MLNLKTENERTISTETGKSSTANPIGNPTPRDKTIGLDPDKRFYKIEDGDDTEEG